MLRHETSLVRTEFVLSVIQEKRLRDERAFVKLVSQCDKNALTAQTV